ncbi:hypothetical protein PUNSTDRAFT_111685 [Punctularia strigosozonata HHB-11173 SS5]|uniref:uncharacterized protein n=1 Tax=Punctularia strigosozonata (strain HHB-11173) TaxID=741275 RepID=UPI0004417AAF|nr:uncharacterized protein PUNSTDRAFT_111685 [Punctularia strigosozonata HHB-11173 SS5]EIN11580.1 hypothetical protein PUNSTDRAFT_111685 [Punctularia strigosozonata HHB-11173 SS5]
MAPPRVRRAHRAQPAPDEQSTEQQQHSSNNDADEGETIFVDLIMGTPLSMFVEKDVPDREAIVELINNHGGIVAPGYSGVSYILVDPQQESGQNLYRQYVGKKGKVVLDARWIQECVKAGALQTFQHNWAGCKVTGTETVVPRPTQPVPAPASIQPGPTTSPSNSSEAIPQAIPPLQTQTVPGPSQTQPRRRRTAQRQQQAQPTQIQPAAPIPQSQAPPQPQHHPVQPVPGPSIPNVDPQLQLPQAPPPHQPQPQPQPHVAHHAPPHHMQIPAPPPPHTFYPQLFVPPPVPHQDPAVPTAQHTHPWHGHVAPHQMHHHPGPHMMPARPPEWGAYHPQAQPPPQNANPTMVAPSPYDYRYTDDRTATGAPAPWVNGPNDYYEEPYHTAYQTQDPYMEEPAPDPAAEAAAQPEQPDVGVGPSSEPTDKPRGRKRARTQPAPAPPPTALVANRRNPPQRSPTPPTRVIKSTYGGNLFTSDDVLYLKKYIDYCQEQGLVLSLREICERVAVKAPHHTFYSWRRYCNKHQIRLGGYAMDNTRAQDGTAPDGGDEDMMQDGADMDMDEAPFGPGPSAPTAGPSSSVPRHGMPMDMDQDTDGPSAAIDFGVGIPTLGHGMTQGGRAGPGGPQRDRSPTPPKALFRSTTGKGVAFTEEDTQFLVRFYEYRQSQGRMDMVAFWRDVATKAPHHSRASWMKFWRRHKHEFFRSAEDAPLPQAPEKKMRYSHADDVLLAKFFFHRPEGTSDKIFQNFAREHPHHPWKGWQEHHRIHKATIDHYIQKLQKGENIDEEAPPPK